LNIDYSIIFSLVPYLNQDIITLIGICLLIGAMAKSSQIGLHVNTCSYYGYSWCIFINEIISVDRI